MCAALFFNWEVGEQGKSRRRELVRNPDINVAAARRDQRRWGFGGAWGYWLRVLVFHGVRPPLLVSPKFRDIGSTCAENIDGRLASLLAREWDIGVELE